MRALSVGGRTWHEEGTANPLSVIIIPELGRSGNFAFGKRSDFAFSEADDLDDEYEKSISAASRMLEHSRLANISNSVLDENGRRLAAQNGTFNYLEKIGMFHVEFASIEKRNEIIDLLQDAYGNSPVELKIIDDFTLTSRKPKLKAHEDILDTESVWPWPEDIGFRKIREKPGFGSNVLVGVLDTGIDADHEEFDGREIPFLYVPSKKKYHEGQARGFDIDVAGHGTRVCSILSGKNIGISPNVKLHVASCIAKESYTTAATTITNGLQEIIDCFDAPSYIGLPRIINLSLGFDSSLVKSNSLTTEDEVIKRRILGMQTIIQRAEVRASLHVFAAIGNDGSSKACYPALFKEVSAVGAVDTNGTPWPGSGSSPDTNKPDFFGIGVGIRAAVTRNISGDSRYHAWSGTSFACPFVAGIASLYLAHDPTLSNSDLRQVLHDSGQAVDGQTGRLVRYDDTTALNLKTRGA